VGPPGLLHSVTHCRSEVWTTYSVELEHTNLCYR